MTLITGKRILGGGALVCVEKDREGYYFTFSADGTGKRIRLVRRNHTWKYTLPQSSMMITAVFTDPPKKSHV